MSCSFVSVCFIDAKVIILSSSMLRTDYCCDQLLISHCKIAGKSMTNRTMCFTSLNCATDKGFMILCESCNMLLRIFRVMSHQCKRRWKWWKGGFLPLLFKTTGQITLMFPSTVAQGSDPRGRAAGPKDLSLWCFIPTLSHVTSQQLGLGYSCILQFAWLCQWWVY
jgi:hypothetical protein